MDIRGKVAVVTGASQGIGLAISLALARRGARLVLVARGEADLEAARRQCLDVGAMDAVAVVADIGKTADLDRIVLESVRRFDGFDVLVNNAGHGFLKGVTEFSDADFDRMVAVNLRGAVLLTQAAVKILRRRHGGQVVQVTSGLAYRGMAGWSVYCATKFGLRGFTEAVREEVARERIKVGMVAPGYTQTHFFDGWPQPVEFKETLQPDDIAHAVVAMVEQGENSDIKEIIVRSPRSA